MPWINETGDPDAIHDNVASEISAVTEKTTPVNADLLLIEDSEASNAKKRLKVGNLPSGGSGSGANPLPLDVVPGSPSSLDDEFDGSSLDVKWTSPATSTSGISTSVADGWLALEPSASGTSATGKRGGYGIRQASPSGDFEVMAKIANRPSVGGNDDARAGIFLGALSDFGYIIGYQSSARRGANQNRFSSYSRTADWGGFSSEDNHTGSDTGFHYVTWFRAVYDRTAQTIDWYWSMSGTAWQTSGIWQSTSVPDIDDIGIALWANSTSTSVRADHGILVDWFRVVEL